MPDNNKTEEFLQKLAPCIEHGELDACVEEAARVAEEMGIGAEELFDLLLDIWKTKKYSFVYVLMLTAAQGLEEKDKSVAYSNAGLAAQHIGKMEKKSEEHHRRAIELNPNNADAHYNYAILLNELNRKDEAEEHYKKAIEINPNFAEAYNNYAQLLNELNRNDVAEKHYKKAIEINPNSEIVHFNYAILLNELNRNDEAEEHYKKAIEINPNYEKAYSNYAILLNELNRNDEAEEHYKKAIEINPDFAEAHNSYANLLRELNRNDEAEEHYKKAIEINPNFVAAHNNYANLLNMLSRKDEAEEHYKKAIEINPNYEKAYSNYAILLNELNKKNEAEEYYKKAIEINPNFAEAHGAYGQLLVEFNKRKEAWREIEKASEIFKETGRITQSYLAKAWFHERYSEKNFNRKKFRESGEDAEKAGEEYLNAARTAEGNLKENLTLQGNVLKARSFVRKIPKKSLYKKIFYRFGKNPDISELIDNLRNAANYYEKASHCSAGEGKEICNACFSSISVFSETLNAMSAFIKGDDAEINKDRWLSSLQLAYKIYIEKNLNNGAALVDTLKQLIKCVDELAEHRKVGLHIQEERLGKCYNNLLEVSGKLEGALKVIAEHSVETIGDYAKKQGMGFVGEDKIEKSSSDSWLIGAIIAIILGIISNRLFSWDIDLKLLSFLKSIIFNQSVP